MWLFSPSPVIMRSSKDSTFYIWQHFRSDARDFCHVSVTLWWNQIFTAAYWRIWAFLFAQNKTTHRLWMLQSKQGNMPWNLFRSEKKKQLTVDPEEAVSTRIGTVEYFIANTVFCRMEALMRNNWNQSLLTDDRDATQWRASFCIKPQSVFKWQPLPGNRDKPVLGKTPQIAFGGLCGGPNTLEHGHHIQALAYHSY